MLDNTHHELVPPEEVEAADQEINDGTRQVSIAEYHRIHSGPIPDPSTLAGYEKVLPGAA